MSDLKPCPFCGSANIRLTDVMDFHFVKCDDCGNEGLKDDAEAEAIAAWNRRADATAISERDRRIEALEAELIQSRNFWSDELSASRAECEGLRAERDELRRQVPSDRWYWPEDDTSSDACRDNPREALEYQKPGEIDGYSCGGVAYTNYFGWLPPADDSDSDDEFEVDEPTREAAKAKMQAEIDRRAALSQKENGDAA